jgi:hypothetical protein
MRRLDAVSLLLVTAACARGSGPEPTAPAGAAAAPARPTAAAADATSLRYTASSGRYRLETQQHTEQEMMGNSTVIDATITQLVTVTLAPQADGLAMTVVVDSARLTTTAPGGEAAAAAAATAMTGKRFTGAVTPAGRITALTSPDSANEQVAQMMNGVRQFLPELPAGTFAAGREWTDTVSTTTALGPLNMTTRAIRTHRVAGWETRDGARALHLTTQSAYTISGAGEAQGTPLEMAGAGRMTSDRYVSAAGVFLSATESDSAEINVNVVSMGMSIPVRRSQRATITRLP